MHGGPTMRDDEREKIYDPPNPEARGKMRQRKLPPKEEPRKQQVNGEDHTNDLDLGELDAGLDTAPIPPRGWLLGNSFCRGFVASLFGEGAVGKTALRMAQLLSLAIERSLTGEHVFVRARVLIVSLEDNLDELRRRLRAVCLHHDIEPHEYAGWLFFAAPGRKGGKLLTTDAKHRPVAGQLAAKIIHTIKKRKIDIVCIDPFVKSHSVEENSNSMIDEVVQTLTDIAMEHNICIDSPHHVSKGQGEPGNANRGRGASSLKDGARLVNTLTVMSA